MASGNFVAAGRPSRERENSSAGGDQQWKVCDHETKANQTPHNPTGPDNDPTEPDAPCTALMYVRVEPDDDTSGIHWQNGGRHLPRVNEIVAAAAEIHGAPDLPEQSALRFPGDAVGEASLHLQAFLALHPSIDRCEHITRISWNCSSGGCKASTGNLGDEPTLFGNIDTGSLLRESLIDCCLAQADFVPYVPELCLADKVTRIGHGTGALQLRRAGEHPLERLPVEQGLSRGKRRLLIGHAELYLLKSLRVRHRAGD